MRTISLSNPCSISLSLPCLVFMSWTCNARLVAPYALGLPCSDVDRTFSYGIGQRLSSCQFFLFLVLGTFDAPSRSGCKVDRESDTSGLPPPRSHARSPFHSVLFAVRVQQVLKPMNCTPIFVPLAITRGSYLGYCKQILWPAFHNVRRGD